MRWVLTQISLLPRLSRIRMGLGALCIVLFAGCTTTQPSASHGVLFKGDGASLAINGRYIGTTTSEGLAFLTQTEKTLEITAFKAGYLPWKTTLSAPFPTELDIKLTKGPEYLSDLLTNEGVRFVRRGPDLLVLEPANRPVSLKSSYRVFVPRRQQEVLLYVAEITPLYIILRSDDGIAIAMPILHV